MPIKLTRQQLMIIAGGIAVVIIVITAIVLGLRPSGGPDEPVTLTVWAIEDVAEIDNDVRSLYQSRHTNVALKYKKIPADVYESQLLNALAAGTGPDVFMIKNTGLPKAMDKLTPAPLPSEFKDDLTRRAFSSISSLDIQAFGNYFPRAVVDDFTKDGRIYASPLYFDTLALVYNKDIFDQAGIIGPPSTWEEFQDMIPKLVKLDSNGKLERAAAAIGGSEINIDSAVDLLNLLMIQNGTKMVNDDLVAATFQNGNLKANMGLRAFNFYLQFANDFSPYFTWNLDQPNSIDAFAAGKVAMIFTYQSRLEKIKKKGPFLNIGIVPMPKPAAVETVVNYPEYWGMAVSKNMAKYWWGWDFIMSITTDQQKGKTLARPPALKTLIDGLKRDPQLGVFANQALTARSWYQVDDVKIKNIFNDAIEKVLSGEIDSSRALNQAQDQVNQLMNKYIQEHRK